MTHHSITISLNRETGLGLTVHSSCGYVFISSVGVVRSVGVWDPDVSPVKHFCAGDRLDAIEDYGGDKDTILNQLRELTGNAARFTFTKPGKPLVVRGVKKPIGLKVFVHSAHSYLHVEPENTGSMKKWNDEHPDDQVRAGDRIVSVNCVSGEAETLVDIMTCVDEMDLTFLRYPVLGPALSLPRRPKRVKPR